jgi:hypothetical protein
MMFTPEQERWLAERIRELADTPLLPGDPRSLTMREAVARKLARDLQAEDPAFDVVDFLRRCGFALALIVAGATTAAAQTVVPNIATGDFEVRDGYGAALQSHSAGLPCYGPMYKMIAPVFAFPAADTTVREIAGIDDCAWLHLFYRGV